MSLHLINAHTGESYSPPSSAQSSLDAFKSWLSQKTSLAPSDHILLTSTGKQARLQSLQSKVSSFPRHAAHKLTAGQHEIFLYSRQLISASSSSPTPDLFKTRAKSLPSSPPPPPSASVPCQDDIQAWRRVFDNRRTWAHDLFNSSTKVAQDIYQQCNAVENVQKGLGVAVGNLQTHVRTLESKYGQARDWAQETCRDQDAVLLSVHNSRKQMDHLPANTEFLRLLPKLDQAPLIGKDRRPDGPATLSTFAAKKSADQHTKTVQEARRFLTGRLSTLEIGLKKVHGDRDGLVDAANMVAGQAAEKAARAAEELLEEIKILMDKIRSDSDHVAGLQSSAKSIAQVSKMAERHTKQYLPTLSEYFGELLGMAQQAEQDRSSAARESLSTMQGIGRIEASVAQTNQVLNTLSISEEAEEAFQVLDLLGQLPFIYGALIVEAVRRHEWSDKLRADSAELAEDLAGHREEEQKRRKRWMKNIGHLISPDASTGEILTFEIELDCGSDAKLWPQVMRDDISIYLDALRQLEGVDETIEELTDSLKDLDKPTRRQIRRAKGNFKNGSIHEANAGGGSFMMRENEDVRTLKELNARLEDDIKGQKSRVRRLEDLMYQQQQRPSSGNLFAPSDQRRDSLPHDQAPQSPGTEGGLSGKASTTSRRQSLSKAGDDKALARRVATLEAELQEERQKRHEEATTRANDRDRVKSDIEEPYSTKKDLMDNMEAQQREFADERRLLQNEVRDQKIKLEELEDELDRILGSRDNDRNASDERARDLDMKLQETQKTVDALEAEKASRMETEAEHTVTMHSVRRELGAETSPPDSLAELLHELEELASRSTKQANDLQHTLTSYKSEKDALHAALDRQEKEFESYKDQTRALQDEITAVRGDCDSERARATSINIELEDARSQLKSLRSKFADGETGSGALRARLEEQAARAGSLATELAQSKSHVNSLDFELSSLQRRHTKLEANAESSSKRLEQRSSRDRELTQAIAGVQDGLVTLLEGLGLSVFYKDGALAIQRTTKLVNASQSGLADSVSLPLPSRVDLHPSDAQLRWMHASTTKEESQLFTELLSKVTALNVSTFSEAMYKLRRDVEWTGKKWKQEARGLRGECQRLGAEAKEKIAFRSFKEGDLALFLPTRNNATRPWAAFNIGAPHYFLREQDSHKLGNREWLVARITKAEERQVDLSKSLTANRSQDNTLGPRGINENASSNDDDNPFELSDGLRWYLLDATEEKPGAPSTPGLGKSTVASANVDAKGSVRMRRSPKDPKDHDVSKMLNKSLETDRSRRSSTSSKRASISAIPEETEAALQQMGSPKPRPGSRSSANAPTMDALGGLAIANQDGSASSSARDMRPGPDEPKAKPIPSPSRAHDALQAASVSPSKAPMLGIFGTSASPPKSSSWFNRSPSRPRAPALNHVSSSSSTSPTKAGPSTSISPSKRNQHLSASQPSGDRRLASTSASPSKRPSQSQAVPAKQTAWESLWSVDFGVEEGNGRAK